MEVPEIPGGSRRSPALVVGVWALTATLGLATASPAQQSPFSQPNPRSSGSFTLPSSSEPSRGATPRRNAESPASPGSPLSPLRPAPGAGPVVSPGATLPPPLPPSGEGSLSPSPLLEGEAPSQAVKLPPKPRVAPPLSAEPTGPISKVDPVVLKAGMPVTLRICQVISRDGLCAGERLLNSKPAIQEGDRFLAEVIDPCPPQPSLVGGVVTKVVGPGHFGRPGYVGLQLTQLVQKSAGGTALLPWKMDTADRRFAAKMRRVLLSTLLSLEGAGTGASVGAQYSGGNMALIGGGMGIGAVMGMAYATLQRGTEAYLEPGDTFEIVVGTTDIRPVSREMQTILYPAVEPTNGKAKKK